MRIDSLVVKGIDAAEDTYHAVVPPIYLSTTYAQEKLGEFGEFAYGRGGNPTRNNLEQLFAKIEGVDYSYAFASGMAATTAVFNLFKNGDRILLNNNVYGGTYRYVDNIFEKQGISYELVDDFNSLTLDDFEDDVAAVFIETPSNPLLRVTDLERIVEFAHTKGILVIIDNTFMTPYFQKPFDYGVDIVVYSATKYIGGHADAIAGLVTTNSEKIASEIKFLQNTLGGILTPTDSYNLIKGLKTLSVRLDRQETNTRQIINYLTAHPAVDKVYYAGAHSDIEKKIHEKQASGLGAVISLQLREDVSSDAFIQSLQFFDLAVSLGGVESLICHPASMTHESYEIELQEKIGIKQNLLRLAIGIENIDDLIADLAQALDKASKQS